MAYKNLPRKNFPPDLTKCRCIWCFALLLLPCASSACFGQTVKIRIVNATNENPVKNQKVSISGISGKGDTQQEDRRKLLTKPTTPDLRLITDGNGEAEFELPKPAPDSFYVRAELSVPLWDCTCLIRVSTEEVMQKGFMTTSHGNKGSPANRPIQPKAGEILYRLRPTPGWMRIFWPLLVDH
jgi:hypothetical protein